jgi:hypothetical protein
MNKSRVLATISGESQVKYFARISEILGAGETSDTTRNTFSPVTWRTTVTVLIAPKNM